ncbi:MAG: enoyl-CoA hydratase-related protein [Bacteroidetes bacterium]|nr:enoyl-CoA hydratase-related protein [Bacteroidota bacterium]
MEFLTIKKQNHVFEICLNRPEKRNALNSEFVQELKAAFAEAASDTETKIILLRANGDAFCAGADLAYLQQLQSNSFEENLADSTQLKELFALIYTQPKITVAQVEGHALAGGCGLTTVCDFVFAIPEANFGYTEVKIGFIPAIVMYFLLRKIGEAQARRLLLTGDLVSADFMKNLGLVYEVCEKENIANQVETFCQKIITTTSAEAVALTRKMIAEIQTMEVAKGLQYAANNNAHARATEDCKRGIAAFLNKEKLSW